MIRTLEQLWKTNYEQNLCDQIWIWSEFDDTMNNKKNIMNKILKKTPDEFYKQLKINFLKLLYTKKRWSKTMK